jgi:nicotinamide riboside kinase
MKIGVIGAHGCGKTDIALQITSRIKSRFPGLSVDFLRELVRQCPYPINRISTIEAQQWIYHAQMVKELEHARRNDILVCDRTVLDGFVYAIFQGFHDFVARQIPIALGHFNTYDHVLFVRPESPPHNDGVRDSSIYYQAVVDQIFEKLISEYHLPVMEGRDVEKFCERIFKQLDEQQTSR